MALPELEENFVQEELARSFPSTQRLYDWYAQDLSSVELVDSAMDAIDGHCTRLREALLRVGAWSDSASTRLGAVKASCKEALAERRAEIEEYELERADYMYDQWKEQRYEERYEVENGRFSDVDE